MRLITADAVRNSRGQDEAGLGPAFAFWFRRLVYTPDLGGSGRSWRWLPVGSTIVTISPAQRAVLSHGATRSGVLN
jgi:hypothetical protein